MTVGILILILIILNILLFILVKTGDEIGKYFFVTLVICIDIIIGFFYTVVMVISHWNTPISF